MMGHRAFRDAVTNAGKNLDYFDKYQILKENCDTWNHV